MPSPHWPPATPITEFEAALQYSGSFHGNMPYHLLVGPPAGSQGALLYCVGGGIVLSRVAMKEIQIPNIAIKDN